MDLRQRSTLRRLLLIWPCAWVCFCLLTGTYADNARYCPGMIPFLLVGIFSSAIALVFSLRGWYHLLGLPIWCFLSLELLVLITVMFH